MVKIAEKFAEIFDKQRRAAREIVDAIEEPRLEIMEWREKRDKIKAAPIATDEVKERVAKELAWAELRARESFHASSLSTPPDGDHVTDSRIREAFAREPLGALLILGFRDDIYESLIEIATKESAKKGQSYTRSERAAALVRIDDAILDAERREEQLCRAAEEAGIAVSRRPDANMRFVLAEKL